MSSSRLHILPTLAMALTLAACGSKESFENTPRGNFEALWEIIDTRYCFLDYKAQEYGLDWDQVHRDYSQKIDDNMSQNGLFQVLSQMLSELRDGHVNLYTSGDIGRYWQWFEDYPTNYSADLISKYLGTDYKIASGFKYTILPDGIGYVTYETFTKAVTKSSLDAVLNHFYLCNGIIIDVRGNGGGNVSNATSFVKAFVTEKRLVGYMCHKRGPGHSDFSPLEERMVEPHRGHNIWQKPVVVLTNRSCFSATNAFVNDMSTLPNVTIMGDKTGGGSGMPISSELPNGWSIRYSASPMFDINKEHIEFGIEPDIYVALDSVKASQGIDTIIEAAREWINSMLK